MYLEKITKRKLDSTLKERNRSDAAVGFVQWCNPPHHKNISHDSGELAIDPKPCPTLPDTWAMSRAKGGFNVAVAGATGPRLSTIAQVVTSTSDHAQGGENSMIPDGPTKDGQHKVLVKGNTAVKRTTCDKELGSLLEGRLACNRLPPSKKNLGGRTKTSPKDLSADRSVFLE